MSGFFHPLTIKDSNQPKTSLEGKDAALFGDGLSSICSKNKLIRMKRLQVQYLTHEVRVQRLVISKKIQEKHDQAECEAD